MAKRGGEGQATGASSGTPDVFISYASPDAAVATALVETLERHGIGCWIAPRDVKGGALYADAIVRAINGTNAFVLVLSENSIASSHVGKEIERASSKKRPIIAMRIDSAPLTPALEYFLSESQWIDAKAGNMEAPYAKLLDAIREREQTAPHTAPVASLKVSTGTISTVQPESHRNRILLAAGLAVVAAAVAALLADKFLLSKHVVVEQPTTAATNIVSDKSIAVLPFADMSEKKDQEYFADGMAEEVLNLLVKVPGIVVIGRTSSFQFKGTNQDLRTIGTKLSAAYLLEGSVRRSNDRVRVTAQLIDSRTGAHRWSETYDRPAADTLKLQDDIAAGLARALQVSVGADRELSRRGSTNDEAYDLYLRGRIASDRGDIDGMATAIAYLHHHRRGNARTTESRTRRLSRFHLRDQRFPVERRPS